MRELCTLDEASADVPLFHLTLFLKMTPHDSTDALECILFKIQTLDEESVDALSFLSNVLTLFHGGCKTQ
jgi:hypothetical protein